MELSDFGATFKEGAARSSEASSGTEEECSEAVESSSVTGQSTPATRLPAGALRRVTMMEMVFPEQTNHYGTLFGGQAMALMDKAAFLVASRYARRNVVTASNERCDFHVPVRQGQLVELNAEVVRTGRTSMVVEVALHAEDLLTGDRQLGTRGRFVMVALDAHGRPTAVPPIMESSMMTE